jgi:hypothetical protein
MQIHPQARTTPAVRVEIARSTEPTSVVANAMASATRRSANGASVVSKPARTDQAGQSDNRGARLSRSAQSSALYDERQLSRWMT